MTELTSDNVLTLRSVVGARDGEPGLCDRNYFIPSYQRGYRWGRQQVEQLLRDLTEYFTGDNKGDFYCLQPIVVKEITAPERKQQLGLPHPQEAWYEVIDGQQRLTTILIILTLERLLDDDVDHSFRIHYETRPELGSMFDRLTRKKSADDPKKDILEVADAPARLDIDAYHIMMAARAILDFFQNEVVPGATKKFFKGTFYENFTRRPEVPGKSVKVIWYELRDHDAGSAVELFKRLNDKSIKLNNAELIRALFLSESACYEPERAMPRGIHGNLREIMLARERSAMQQHLISQWDMIEARLHDTAFWNFIHKDGDKARYNCRIEYIFDLIAGRSEHERDPHWTLLKFQELSTAQPNGLWALWKKVELYFAILQAWLGDREKYHKIGFIISQGGNGALTSLLSEATSMNKSKFNAKIDERIRDLINLTPTQMLQLEYGRDSELIERVLMLFNVEYTRLSESEPLFPFEKFKKHGWTLEHIHAQNSELIDGSDRHKWAEFIKENIKVLRGMAVRFGGDPELDPSPLIAKLEANYVRACNKEDRKFSFSIVQQLYSEIASYFDKFAREGNQASDLHSISNLALLSGSVNSAIGNSVFEVKRQMIVDYDARGEYIPICTRKAFLKYYNNHDEGFSTAQLFYWGKQDQDNYLAEMQRTLASYLKPDTPVLTTQTEEQ